METEMETEKKEKRFPMVKFEPFFRAVIILIIFLYNKVFL